MKGWILGVGLLLAAGRVLAGTEITIETRKAGAAPELKPQRSVVEVEGRSLRAEGGSGRHGAIWRGAEGVLEILDHGDKSVMRIDRGTAQSLSRSVEGAREGVRGQIGGLPAAQREAIERWIGGDPPARVELRSSGGSAQVSGVSCLLREVLRNGVRLAEICEGPAGSAGVTAAALTPVRELAAFLAEVGDLLPSSLGAEGLETLALATQVEGVPLRVRAWPKDAVATESRIVGARTKAFAADRFAVPAGYEPRLGVHVRQ